MAKSCLETAEENMRIVRPEIDHKCVQIHSAATAGLLMYVQLCARVASEGRAICSMGIDI